ncbi:hypothetical protein BU23DRAFT_553301 [Bimuria novae-zelandiae CBS 107.79]|uniref:Uncharacterized protein n=1 Tax=Bimuria novae-zelandiae CBS 107.79 TaxID=1447943 RepID=A0A6A5VBW7_9PLEO|nr:hypothetical protein BU23DRAFT_553301 [Bimuria novae-zelandiae CBS 107.79]
MTESRKTAQALRCWLQCIFCLILVVTGLQRASVASCVLQLSYLIFWSPETHVQTADA